MTSLKSKDKKENVQDTRQSERKEPPFSSRVSVEHLRAPVFPSAPDPSSFFPRSLRELRTNACGFPAGCPRSIDSLPHLLVVSYTHVCTDLRRNSRNTHGPPVLQSSVARLYTRVPQGYVPPSRSIYSRSFLILPSVRIRYTDYS